MWVARRSTGNGSGRSASAAGAATSPTPPPRIAPRRPGPGHRRDLRPRRHRPLPQAHRPQVRPHRSAHAVEQPAPPRPTWLHRYPHHPQPAMNPSRRGAADGSSNASWPTGYRRLDHRQEHNLRDPELFVVADLSTVSGIETVVSRHGHHDPGPGGRPACLSLPGPGRRRRSRPQRPLCMTRSFVWLRCFLASSLVSCLGASSGRIQKSPHFSPSRRCGLVTRLLCPGVRSTGGRTPTGPSWRVALRWPRLLGKGCSGLGTLREPVSSSRASRCRICIYM